MYPNTNPITIYNGTSTYAMPSTTNVNAKGIAIFLQGGATGSGSVTSTLYVKDGYGNDFSQGSMAVSTNGKCEMVLYPGTLGTSSATYTTINGVLTRNWHVDSSNSNNLQYSVSAVEIP